MPDLVGSPTILTPQLLAEVRQALERAGEQIPPWRASQAEIERFRASVAGILAHFDRIPDSLIPDLSKELVSWMCGLGPLQPLIDAPGTEEVIVRKGFVYVERFGKIEPVGELGPDELFREIALRAADLGGRAIWGSKPYVLVDLPEGHRFSAMVPPLSVEGTAINIRVFRKGMSIRELWELGTFSPPPEEEKEEDEAILSFLRDEGVEPSPILVEIAKAIRRNEASILISGEFSSGKTTLLNALLGLIPPTHMVAIVETFRELQPPPNMHPLRAVVPEVLERRGGLPPMKEVVDVLYKRMRPDVIVFGEVVGEEAVPLLDAMNLGKRVMTTIHGEDPYTALLHLEMLALASGLPLEAIRERVARGVNLVLHMGRSGRRRYLREVVRVEGYDYSQGRYKLRTIYDSRSSHFGRH
jgi:pilus assembly protein CpaF